MKRPKNRTTIYVVTREIWDSYEQVSTFIVLDSFRTYERAEEVKGIYEKQAPGFDYEIMASTYYDE